MGRFRLRDRQPDELRMEHVRTRPVSSRPHPFAIFYLHPRILILSFERLFSLRDEKLPKEMKVTPVLFATGAHFHAIKKLGTGERDWDTVDLTDHDTLSGFPVGDSRRACPEVDEDFVSHTDDCDTRSSRVGSRGVRSPVSGSDGPSAIDLPPGGSENGKLPCECGVSFPHLAKPLPTPVAGDRSGED